MARSRYMTPDFYDDTVLARCSHSARLLYPALWQLSDRCGVFEWDVPRIRKYAFGYDTLTHEDVTEWLNELLREGRILRATVDNHEWGLVPKLGKHQHFHRDEKERHRKILDSGQWHSTPEHGASTVLAPGQHPASTPDIGYLISDIGERRAEHGAGTTVPRSPDELSHLGSNHPEVQFFEAAYREIFKGPPLDKLERSRAAEVVRRCAEAKVMWQDVLDFYARGFDFTGHTLEWLRDHLREVLNKLGKKAEVDFELPF